MKITGRVGMMDTSTTPAVDSIAQGMIPMDPTAAYRRLTALVASRPNLPGLGTLISSSISAATATTLTTALSTAYFGALSGLAERGNLLTLESAPAALKRKMGFGGA
jgi:hypothetical protein